MLFYVVLCCSMLFYVVLCCSMLFYVQSAPPRAIFSLPNHHGDSDNLGSVIKYVLKDSEKLEKTQCFLRNLVFRDRVSSVSTK